MVLYATSTSPSLAVGPDGPFLPPIPKISIAAILFETNTLFNILKIHFLCPPWMASFAPLTKTEFLIVILRPFDIDSN